MSNVRVALLSFNVIVPSKSVKKMILGLSFKVSGYGIAVVSCAGALSVGDRNRRAINIGGNVNQAVEGCWIAIRKQIDREFSGQSTQGGVLYLCAIKNSHPPQPHP